MCLSVARFNRQSIGSSRRHPIPGLMSTRGRLWRGVNLQANVLAFHYDAIASVFAELWYLRIRLLISSTIS